MWLKSIELSEVGTFARGVRIDGIGPGLNVLAGANELGKSTVLRALLSLFGEAHKTTRQSVRELRPYGGGAPLIGCSFDLGGGEWWLEKQFLSAQKALLRGGAGEENLQGADAENRLGELLGASGVAQALPLLWVGQGSEGLEIPELPDGVRHSLGQLLAAQADTTSGVGQAQAVLRTVEKELAGLVTKTDRVKKGGAYDKLLAERAALMAALEDARRKAAEAEQRLAQLSELQREEAELCDAEVAAELQAKLVEREKRLAESEEARRHLQRINERAAFLTHQKEQRAQTLADFDNGLVELQKLSELMQEADVELTRIVASLDEFGERRQAMTEAASALEKREVELRAELDAARAASDAASRRERLKIVTAQRARLDAIAVDIGEADEALGRFMWPDDALPRLRKVASEIDQLRARQAAGTPRLRVSYAPGVTRGFAIDGAALEDGADIAAPGPTTVEVEGIGRIEVIPGASEGGDQLEREIDALTAKAAELLAIVGADDLAGAEAREAERREVGQGRELLAKEAAFLAPDGRQSIDAEFEALKRAAAADDGVAAGEGSQDACGRPVEELAGELERVRSERSEAATALQRLAAAQGEAAERRSAIAAELRIRRTRREELEALYVRPEGSDDPRKELCRQVDEAALALNEAMRERAAWQEVALTGEARRELEATIASCRLEIERRGERLGTVRQNMRRIEGTLARDFEDGVGEHAGDLEARCAEAGDRLARMEAHIGALKLLAGELSAEIARRRDEISQPLSERLCGLAARIWPAAEIRLTTELTVGGLERGGQLEAPGAISAGTREQVAVLARLAYAELLAGGAETVPVIFDDPLVFSDEGRLNALFEVMATAAETYQIIVLTCHERAFEPLISRHGAKRLMLAEASAGEAAAQ